MSVNDVSMLPSSAIHSPYLRAPVAHVDPLEPLAVASCPPSPTKRRAPFPPITQLRSLVNKLKPKAYSTRSRTASSTSLLLPSSGNPRHGKFSTTRPMRHRRLTIRDPAFFLPAREAVNVYGDDAAMEDTENTDAAVAPGCRPPPPTPFDAGFPSSPDPSALPLAGFRAPPPTPCDPFRTPPQTPLRQILSAIGNCSAVLRRAAQEKKIVQVFGAEAEEAARQHVEERSVRE